MSATPKPPEKNDARTQADKFADLARELECDEDEAAFDERLRQIAPKERKPEAREE